jgi:phospholipase C
MLVPKSDPLHRFRKDVDNGTLPTVSWLVASERFSDHPGSAWYGGWYVAETLDILTKNPEVWSKTIFILTYDENDGYFDHVPPFVAPEPGNPESGKTSPGIDASLEYQTLDQDLKKHSPKEARGGPLGLGYRVPLIVASPWSRGGFVCSQVFDHTSVLQLLERVLSTRSGKDIRESNISAWRRTVCGDLSATFQPYQGGDAAVPVPSRDAFLEQVHRAQFTRMPSGYRKLSADDVKNSGSWLPKQEPGVRPSTALPYQLAATGALSPDGKRFEISLESGHAVGAPFHVYTPGSFRRDTKLRTRAYAVSAGDRLTDAWELAGFENGHYHLCVCGPNGFLREFAGHAATAQVHIDCKYRSGDVELHFVNHTQRILTLDVKDNAYQRGDHSVVLQPDAKQTLLLPLAESHRWYDFSVVTAESDGFLRRFAGRVETGKAGVSDPLIGRAVT